VIDPPVRVVLLGLGHAGVHLHLPALRRLRGVEVVAGCDPDPARRAAATGLVTVATAGEAWSLAADAVVIATPPATHAPLALEAMRRGRHVYVEKPLARAVEEAGTVVEAATASGLTLQVGYAFRFHPLWQRLTALVDTGRLRLPVRATARFDAEVGTGWEHPALNVGLHHLDLLGSIVGTPPSAVEMVDDRRLRAWWPDGSALEGTYGQGDGADQATLEFANATVSLDRRRGLRLRGAGPRAALPSPSLLRARPTRTGWERSYERALAAFADAAQRGAPAHPGPAEGLQAVRVGTTILRSLADGGRVEVAGGA
jgi:predicted dehydrogenase